jgi:hypothetical protein
MTTRVQRAAAPAARSSQSFEQLESLFDDQLSNGKLDQAIITGGKLVTAATNPADRKIAQTLLAQVKVEKVAQDAETRVDYPAAIKAWSLYVKRWPGQAGIATDHLNLLNTFQTKLPASAGPLSSGADIAGRVLKNLDAAARPPLGFSRAGDAVMLEFRHMMRPLVGLDLNWKKTIAPADAKRFADFAKAIAASGKARDFDAVAVQYSAEDPTMGDGTPNGLLAFGLVKFAPRAVQNAFGIHDPHE